MEYLLKHDIESYFVDFNYHECEWDFEHMRKLNLGRNHHIQILQGTFPVIDGDDGICWYFRLCHQPISNKLGRAVLFTGAEGNGKRTLEQAYAQEMFSKCVDMEVEFKYYEIPLYKLSFEKKIKVAEEIQSLFSYLSEILDKEDYEGTFVYFSLGDITDLVKHKKIVMTIAQEIEKIIAKKSVICFITAYCHKTTNQIPEILQKSCLVLTLEPPSKSVRMRYLDDIQELNPSIKWEMAIKDIAEMTKDFTFAMLKELVNEIYFWALGEIYLQGSDAIKYILGQAGLEISVPEKVINCIIDNVKNRIVKEVPLYQNLSFPNTLVNNSQTNSTEAEDSNNDADVEKLKEKIKSEKLDSVSEMKNFYNSLSKPIELKAGKAEHNQQSEYLTKFIEDTTQANNEKILNTV